MSVACCAAPDPPPSPDACEQVNQYNHTSLLQLDGVNSREEVDFYAGKRVAFVYKAKTLKQGTKFRCIWGRVSRRPAPHHPPTRVRLGPNPLPSYSPLQRADHPCPR